MEVLALEKERFAGDLGECVGKAVTKIQARRVSPFAKVEEGLTRQVSLLHGERLDDYAGPAEKNLALTRGIGPNLAFNHDGEFQEVRGANEAAVSLVNELSLDGRFGFTEKDGGQRGSVEDHLGRPRSS